MIPPLFALKKLRSHRLHLNKRRKEKKKKVAHQIPSAELPPEESQDDKMSAASANTGPLTQASQQKKASHDQGFDGFRDKQPFELRADPFIDSTQKEFLDMESYFTSLVRRTKLTIEEILDTHFEPHEISLFIPTSKPAQLKQLQKDNTRRYLELLKGLFKSHTPSLPFKMTLLYFGLPVEPMRLGVQEIPAPLDLDMDNDDPIIETDPLKFLDDYTGRTYGKQALSLRGGGGDDMEVNFGAGENENGGYENEEQQDAPLPPATGGRVYGYQGSIFAPSLTYNEFVWRVDRLLGQQKRYDYEVCVEIFNEEGNFSQVLERAQGWVRHFINNKKTPRKIDPIYSLLTRYFQNGHAPARFACFVYFKEESGPSLFAPAVNDHDVVRLWDEKLQGISYMRVPRDLGSKQYQSNQYHEDYLRAIKILYQVSHHVYTSPGSGQGGQSYGLLDPPASIWGEVAASQKDAAVSTTLNINPTNISVDTVAILVPGFHNYGSGPGYCAPAGSKYPLWKKELKIKGTQQDGDGLVKLIRDVTYSNSELEYYKDFVGVDVWFPGENFLQANKQPTRIPTNKTATTSMSLAEWRALVLSWPGDQAYRANKGLSMVARPVFSEYRVRLASTSGEFKVDIDTLTLAEFKKLVKENLDSSYDPEDKTQVLHLTQTTWKSTTPEFAIRHETAEADWDWVLRNITEPDITVKLQAWDNEWTIEKGVVWGPRYDIADLTKLSRFVSAKPKPDSSKMDRLFKESMNMQNGAARSDALRERFFWNVPSVFTNPTKPAMPIQGPPLESIIRTGPNMPGISIGMMTPTEMARLQLEVHSLRNQLLDRTRECPYLDCQRNFRFDDGHGLDRHLKQDHRILQCFLCTKKQYLLPLYDGEMARLHFLTEHYDEFKTLFGNQSQQPSIQASDAAQSSIIQGLLSHYCDRCGRDQFLLNNAADRLHHALCCSPLKEGETADPDRYCMDCGRVLIKGKYSWEPDVVAFESCVCGHGPSKPLSATAPFKFCILCGLEYDDSMDQAYREIHPAHCKPPTGHEWDYCAYCGIGMGGLSLGERSTHGWSCDLKPPPAASSPPTGHSGTAPVRVPEKKCSLFDICGVVSTYMTEQQIQAHMDFHKEQGHITSTPVSTPHTPGGTASGTATKPSPIFPTPSSQAAEEDVSGGNKAFSAQAQEDEYEEDDHDDEEEESESQSASEELSTNNSSDATYDGTADSYAWSAQAADHIAAAAASARKRKRASGGSNDPSYHAPQDAEAEPEEEHSEASAVPDPITNLDPNAPRSPKKRVVAKKSVRIVTPAKPETSASSSQAAATAAPVYFPMHPPPLPQAAAVLPGAEPNTPGRRGRKPGPQTSATATRAGRSVRATRAAQEAFAFSSVSDIGDSALPTTRARGRGGKETKPGDDDGDFQLPKTPGRRGRVVTK